MSRADCCQDVKRKKVFVKPTKHAGIGRSFQAIRWVLPTLLLVLIPKCPVCLAAYVLLFSGIALSVATANALRAVLICVSLCALLYVVLTWIMGQTKVLSRHEQ